MINFNTKTGKHELVLNGKIVAKSKHIKYLEKMAAEMNVVDNSEVKKEENEVKFSINERFSFIEKFVKLVARGVSNSLIVAGPGGLGKTHTVTDSLENMGKKEMGIGDLDGDYVVIKGFSTAKALYRTLWENNGKIVIFDDCDSVMKDVIGANILKGALDSYDKRVISWGAEIRGEDDLPQRFEFVGKVIFITNLSLDKIPQAIVSRSLKCDVTMTVEEKVERIEYVLRSDNFMTGINSDVKEDTIAFIKKYAHKFTDLNIRSSMTIVKIRNEFADEDWNQIALYTAVA
jgi:hypothetical protein